MCVKTRYRFRFYPTNRQTCEFARVFGCARFAYNWGLRLRTDSYREGKKVGYHESSALWTEMKRRPEFSWLNEVSCVPEQQTLRHLQTAFSNFFAKRSRYPRFKKKHGQQSAEYTSSAFGWDATNRRLTISKVGALRVRWSREFTSNPSTVTITKDCAGRYFVTLCLNERIEKLPRTSQEVGIDFGLSRLATLSDGERIANPRYLRKRERKLTKAQRILSRRIKGSGRWRKQQLKVARIHAKIADSRKDYLDKITINLVRRFDWIYVEDLNLRGMVCNHRFAKNISDAAIGMAINMLEYKAERYGKVLNKIDRFWPSSKTCSSCGFRLEHLSLGVRKWNCPECGTQHDRDENAAKNILAVGHTVTARGGTVRRPRALACGRKSLRNVNPPRKVL